jgi:hypothetical protein
MPRKLLIAGALLLPLLGIVTLMIFIVQPFADAVGGCGGG